MQTNYSSKSAVNATIIVPNGNRKLLEMNSSVVLGLHDISKNSLYNLYNQTNMFKVSHRKTRVIHRLIVRSSHQRFSLKPCSGGRQNGFKGLKLKRC